MCVYLWIHAYRLCVDDIALGMYARIHSHGHGHGIFILATHPEGLPSGTCTFTVYAQKMACRRGESNLCCACLSARINLIFFMKLAM